MDLTVGFVSRNLVTQTNFIEFRGSWIFEKMGFWWVPKKNEILGNN